ncbi:MAG: hypothetical protein NTV24_04980 [Candidatus Woesebacteria bacterium]|nr:hypothetical protein [Candidatus Woesebacteria bacterium]
MPEGSSETAQPIEALRSRVERLKFDVVDVPMEPKFHNQTAADLRNDEPARLQHYTELLTRRAERDMQEVLEVRDEAKFSKYTGMPLPEKVLNEKGGLTHASSEARLGIFRGDCGYLVEEARKKGIEAPKFDSETGVPIPQDSLRALLEVRKLQQREQERNDAVLDAEDLQMGLNALAELKRIKREDEAARVIQGLSPKQ